MTLKDGTYIIASTLSTNPVLDIYGATIPFDSPIAGIVGLSVLLRPIFFWIRIYISQAQNKPPTTKTNSGR